MDHRFAVALAVTGLCLGAVEAQGSAALESAAPERLEKALRSFQRLSPRGQKAILREVRAAVGEVEDDYLKSVRACIAQGHKLVSKSKLKTRQKKGDSEPTAGWRKHVPFPVEREYAFGYGKAYRVDPLDKRVSVSKRQMNLRLASLKSMVQGNLPDLDLAVVAILHRMDRSSGAEEFRQLLETWRNGPESFYHALDRTAGTEQSVFFYDAMLEAFVVSCVPKRHDDYRSLRGNLQRSHDALHKSFLAYRQYRAFREAAALSLLLSPEAPMPPALKRYDGAAGSQYSTRQQLSMLLRAAEQDVLAVVSEISKSARPLPETLWDVKYDPFPAFQALVDGKRSEFLKFVSHTDKLAAQERVILVASHRKVAAAAGKALLDALTSRKL